MSSVTAGSHEHAHSHEEASVGDFLSTYVFSRDHKIIGIQFLFSTLLWFLIGGLLDADTQRQQPANTSRTLHGI